MKKRLFPILSSLFLIATFPRTSFAAFPYPGEDLHERYILSFSSDEYPFSNCKNTISADNLRLTEILRRRVGADIAEKHYTKAIARLKGLLKAAQLLPSAQARSEFLLYLFAPYTYIESIYDGASVRDLENPGYPYQRSDALIELIVRQSWVDTKIPAEALLEQIEALNQPLGLAYGVPKAITFIRLSRQYNLLEQHNVHAKERLHQRALAQLKAAALTITLIRNTPIKINMLIILGRRYAAMGEMATAKTLLDQSVQLLQQTKISNPRQMENLSGLLGQFQTQLGQFEAALATSGVNLELIKEMLKSRSPQSVLPLAQQIISPPIASETKAQALGLVAIAFAQQGQPVQGRKILEEAIRTAPLDEFPYDIDHQPFLLKGSQHRKPTIRLEHVFPLVWNYAQAGQTESALDIAKSTGSAALSMALKAAIANEYARKGDLRAQTVMGEVRTQMDRASQVDTYPVVGMVFSELMENHQYRFAWDMTKAIDAKAWERFLHRLTPIAPRAWPFLERMHGWQSEVIKAAIADKRYDIVLEATRGDYDPLKIAIPALVKAGLVKEALTATRRAEPRYRAELLAILALKLDQQQKLAPAKQVWTEAITAARQIKEGRERAWAFIQVAAQLQYTSHQTQLNGLLQNIINTDRAYRNDKSYPWIPVIQEAVEFALVRQSPDLAIRLVEMMSPSVHRERNRILLFQSLLSFWDEYIPEAETVLAKMPRSAFKIRSQIALADAYFTWGEFQNSSAILHQAKADLQNVQDAEIVQDRSRIGYKSMFENRTPWLLTKNSRASLLGYIALGYTKTKDYPHAVQSLQSIPNPQIRNQWRSHLACYSASP